MQVLKKKAFGLALFVGGLAVGSLLSSLNPGMLHWDSRREAREANAYWAKKIRDGGYILHFRHGHRNRYTTTPRTPETNVSALDAAELALGLKGENTGFGLVTCLTDEGKEEARLVGTTFRILNMSVSSITSSPSCRAHQTAFYGFGTEGKILNSLLHRTSVMSDQSPDFNRNLKEYLMKLPIQTGKNALLFGHVGTFGKSVIDVNETKKGGFSNRDDIGFIVIERVGEQLIARHMFSHFNESSQNAVKLPLN